MTQSITNKSYDILPLLTSSDLLFGLEKESLRITPQGRIAQSSHPSSIGAALTNSIITTDYSEALLELITPPERDIDKALNCLMAIHGFIYQYLPNELLWVCSMPPAVQSEEEIPIARYGTSNLGKLKHIYRQGLAYRYGRRMQAIAGIHFNFSVSSSFWEKWHQQRSSSGESLRSFVDKQYLGSIRNYFRRSWVLVYLFGASPAVDTTFTEVKPTSLQEMNNSWIGEYATSLRMSDIGYGNSKQSHLNVSYNSLSEYINGLQNATSTIEPAYYDIGIKGIDGKYKQLNANILQMEAEYYSSIRPKRKPEGEERPLQALSNRGIDYIEARTIDLNPFQPAGITKEDAYFLHLFLLSCLLETSPLFTPQESREGVENKLRVANYGRQPELTLQRNGNSYPMKMWLEEIFDSLSPIASWLDSQSSTTYYTEALEAKRELVVNPTQLPSAQLIALMQKEKLSFVELGLHLSEKTKKAFHSFTLPDEKYRLFKEIAEKSLTTQTLLEKSDTLSFEAYLAKYGYSHSKA